MSAAAPPDRLAILFVGERADFFGGGQRSLLDLADWLRRRGGAEPKVVVPWPGPLAASLAERGIEVHHLFLPALAGPPWRVAAAVGALARLARATGAAVLHSDAPRAALYAGLAARWVRRPHVWHLRASIPSSGAADRLLLRLSDQVVAVSRAAAARSAALSASTRVRVVPTGIEPPLLLDRRAAREALGLPHDRFVAGLVGRLEPDKGGEDAVRALPALRRAEPRALLAFLGEADGRDDWPLTFRLRIAASGLGDAVRFLGGRPDAARLLPAFDLLLHPSRHEALPRVLIEALWAGVPAVAYAVGGVGEVLAQDAGGVLVPARDAAAFAETAAALAADPERRRALALAGRARAPEFDIERMGRAILDLYARLRRAPVAAEPAGEAA